jgi:hypothetical protein
MVVDLLLGEERVELTSAWCQQDVPGWREVMDQCRYRGHPAASPEEVAEELRERGSA